MEENDIKAFKKWVKACQKLGLSSAKLNGMEFTAAEKPEKKARVSKKADTVEGLTHDEEAKMPNESELLFYSTETFDSIRESRKDPIPR